MIVDKLLVAFHCNRCHRGFTVQLHVGLDRDGDFVIPAGTLDNDWALRWARSHAEPSAALVVPG